MPKNADGTITVFENYCTCGGYAWTMNGRPESDPHMPWCPQKAEYDAWYKKDYPTRKAAL